ncbi:MAG: hypothetical protein H6711_15475 [Myxococcales bacterium]|nr:hypothetical protein [Myxococcales bacterium]
MKHALVDSEKREPHEYPEEVFAEAYAGWLRNSRRVPREMIVWFDKKFGLPPIMNGKERDLKYFAEERCKTHAEGEKERAAEARRLEAEAKRAEEEAKNGSRR